MKDPGGGDAGATLVLWGHLRRTRRFFLKACQGSKVALQNGFSLLSPDALCELGTEKVTHKKWALQVLKYIYIYIYISSTPTTTTNTTTTTCPPHHLPHSASNNDKDKVHCGCQLLCNNYAASATAPAVVVLINASLRGWSNGDDG